MTSNRGAHWLLEDRGGVIDPRQDSGQDYTEPTLQAADNTATRPLEPLQDVVRIRPATTPGVIPESFLRFYALLKRGTIVC